MCDTISINVVATDTVYIIDASISVFTLIPVLKTMINQPMLTYIGPLPMTTKLVTSNPPLCKKEVVEANVGEVVVLYNRQV